MTVLKQNMPGFGRFPAASVAFYAVALITLWRTFQVLTSSFNLSFDEAQYWTWSHSFEWGYFSKPPFIAWVIALTTGIGGNSEPWIRIGTTFAHAGTALLVYGIGATLFPGTQIKKSVGLWSALAYLTLPAVSVSSVIISTDAFLLFFWALALLGVAKIMQGGPRTWWGAVGIGLGFGLLSKYAMAFFVISLALLGVWSQPWRNHMKRWPFWAAMVGGCALFAPNIWWNMTHGLVSYRHTGANASLGADLFHPLHLAEFIVSQAGVFGPLLFGVLCLLLVTRPVYTHLSQAYRLLMTFTVPVLAIMSVQALLSRANANWAAPAFIAATPLVVAWCLEKERWTWVLKISLPLHILLALILYNIPVLEAAFGRHLPPTLDITRRLYGWDQAGEWVQSLKTRHPDLPLLFSDRKTMATLLYYGYPLVQDSQMWFPKQHPENHYEMSAPFDPAPGSDVLYVTKTPDVFFRHYFSSVVPVSVFRVSSAERSRELHAYHLHNFLGYDR